MYIVTFLIIWKVIGRPIGGYVLFWSKFGRLQRDFHIVLLWRDIASDWKPLGRLDRRILEGNMSLLEAVWKVT